MLRTSITQPIGQPKTTLRMTAVPETPPGAILDGARKTVRPTTNSRAPPAIRQRPRPPHALSPLVPASVPPLRRSGRRHPPHGMRGKRKRLHVTDPRQGEAAVVEGGGGELGRGHA